MPGGSEIHILQDIGNAPKPRLASSAARHGRHKLCTYHDPPVLRGCSVHRWSHTHGAGGGHAQWGRGLAAGSAAFGRLDGLPRLRWLRSHLPEDPTGLPTQQICGCSTAEHSTAQHSVAPHAITARLAQRCIGTPAARLRGECQGGPYRGTPWDARRCVSLWFTRRPSGSW